LSSRELAGHRHERGDRPHHAAVHQRRAAVVAGEHLALRWEAPGLRGLVLLLCVAAAWCILDGFWQLLPSYDLLWLLKRRSFWLRAAAVCWLFLLLDYKGELGGATTCCWPRRW